jgi:uncharacterized RDD family membrane protein YckC
MGSALLNPTTEPEFAATGSELATPAASAEELRLQVAERLAAHRSRRGAQTQQPANPAPLPAQAAASRSARIAATVAERYANTQSYRAFLAAEAERAIQQARAAAEVAAMNAQAVAAAQQRMLEAFDEHATHAALESDVQPDPHLEVSGQQDSAAASDPFLRVSDAAPQPQPVELNLWPELDAPDTAVKHQRPHRPVAAHRASSQPSNVDPRTSNPAPLTVRLYEDASSAAHVDMEGLRHTAALARPQRFQDRNDAEARALDEEIAFRQAPVFEEPAGPPMPLPANLIAFPRQLVASRKARPRYAEGPLRDEAEAAPGDGQLRIFEVDPGQISTKPAGDSDTAATPQWTSLWLDTPEVSEMDDDRGPEQVLESGTEFDCDSNVAPLARTVPPLEPAPIARRLLAGAINAAIVLAGVLAFAGTLAAMSGYRFPADGSRLHALLQLARQLPAETGLQPAQIAVIGAAAAALLCLLYQALFFCFSVATPGMRLVRIALCTFDDENPTRPAIRKRAAAMLLSACPFALGFAWAALDEDRLTWHDRISKMYLRKY